MNKFYWWRRYPKRKKLQPKDAHKLKPFILQQVEHGDFDESDYKRQAEEELKTRDKELKAFVKSYRAQIQNKIIDIETFNEGIKNDTIS